MSVAMLFCMCYTVALCTAAPETMDPGDFARLSIEELMGMEITSVSRRSELLSDAAAAVFVITADDIRRSGATTIPDVLRMAPGLHVARIDASTWAVTSRGFNGFFANKLLVLIDGRSVYTPTFSGVHWDVHDTLMDDIERIEVIRGPGAAMWGANAVNGVINIITKSTRQTQGGRLSAGIGTEEHGFGEIRYGAELGSSAHYRVWAKGFMRDDLRDADDHGTRDDWDGYAAGFRIDQDVSDADTLTLSGDFYSQVAGETLALQSFDAPFRVVVNDDKNANGGNILGRWTHQYSETSEMSLQIYYNRLDRRDAIFEETYDTFDIDFQHTFTAAEHHEVVWGLGYRLIKDHFDNSFSLALEPRSRTSDLVSGFIQDSIDLCDDRIKFVVGSKFEHNDYTGFEVQPTLRLLINPGARHVVWGAVSRAVRTPSRADHDSNIVQLVQPLPQNPMNPNSPERLVVRVHGDDNFDSEEMLAYEVGYRVEATDRLSFDFAGYFNEYQNFRTLEQRTIQVESMPPPLKLVQPVSLGNKMSGEAYGGELAATWIIQDWWRCQLAATFFYGKLTEESDSTDTLSEGISRTSPHHQYFFRSNMELAANIELDMTVRFVDNLTSRDIDNYATADIRLAWYPTSDLEFSVVAENLADDRHLEFEAEFLKARPTENERRVFARVAWHF